MTVAGFLRRMSITAAAAATTTTMSTTAIISHGQRFT